RRHTRSYGDWSSDVCSSDLNGKLYHIRNRRVAQHGLRTRGRNRDEFLRASDGVADMVKLAVIFLVYDLEIGNRGHASRAPVDDEIGRASCRERVEKLGGVTV